MASLLYFNTVSKNLLCVTLLGEKNEVIGFIFIEVIVVMSYNGGESQTFLKAVPDGPPRKV